MKAGCSCMMQAYNRREEMNMEFDAMKQENPAEIIYAGFWARLAAYLIDLVLAGVIHLAVRLTLALSFTVFQGENLLDLTFLFQYSIKDALLYAVGAAYFILCTYFLGATVGKMALNLRVVSSNGGRPAFFDVLYRETIGRFLAGFVLGIGYIMAGFTQEKKGLHDILADTRVIYGKCGTRRNGREAYTQQRASLRPQSDQPQKEQNGPKNGQSRQNQDAVQVTKSATGTLYDRYQHINIEPSDEKSTEDKEQK